MIRKRVSMLVLGIFFLMGACNSVSEGNQTESDNDTPGTIDPGNETKKPVMDQDPVTIEQTHEEILEEVKAAIVTDVDVKLPEDVLTSDGFLTAATSSSTDSYEVNFYVTNVPVAVNDPSLEDAHPYMIVYGTKFDSEDGAKAKINYQPVQDGGEEMDLGYGVTGHMDAGAGSIFLTWNEGHWSFSTRNHNSEEGSKEMIALAKQIVGKLESQMLPAPHAIGAGTFDMDSNGAAANSLMWQEGETVYELYTEDPLLLIDTITGYMGQ